MRSGSISITEVGGKDGLNHYCESRYACSMTAAEAESTSPFSLDGECPASLNRRSASLVEKRSSSRYIGTLDTTSNDRQNSFTTLACWLVLPFRDIGMPTTIAATWYSPVSDKML